MASGFKQTLICFRRQIDMFEIIYKYLRCTCGRYYEVAIYHNPTAKLYAHIWKSLRIFHFTCWNFKRLVKRSLTPRKHQIKRIAGKISWIIFVLCLKCKTKNKSFPVTNLTPYLLFHFKILSNYPVWISQDKPCIIHLFSTGYLGVFSSVKLIN